MRMTNPKVSTAILDHDKVAGQAQKCVTEFKWNKTLGYRPKSFYISTTVVAVRIVLVLVIIACGVIVGHRFLILSTYR